jgi:hypothetical protein
MVAATYFSAVARQHQWHRFDVVIQGVFWSHRTGEETKMRPQHSGQPKASAERVVKDIRRPTRHDKDRHDFDEQITRIEQMIVEIQTTRPTMQFEPGKFYVQVVLASAALLAAGGAIAQAIFP